ncbi:lysine histidine transporter-like 8-like, partial [Trifolium medium]|nr:lysine histidine transporter-like 8-like [Trifolium medium]
MGEAKEIWSAPITPRTGNSLLGTPMVASPPVSCPPSQLHSPSLTRSPLLQSENGDVIHPKSKTPKTPRTPRMSLTPRFITPLGSPMRKALRLTKLDPQDAWLPITESRNGNKYYA